MRETILIGCIVNSTVRLAIWLVHDGLFVVFVGFRRLLRSRSGVYPGCYKQGAPTELYVAEELSYPKGLMSI